MLDGHLLEVGDIEPGFLALLKSGRGVFGDFVGDVGLRRGLMAAATAVGSVTLVTRHAGYPR